MPTYFKTLALGLLLCNAASAAFQSPFYHHQHFPSTLLRRNTANSTATECGRDAAPGNETCPLNVCCSEFGNCGTAADLCGKGCQSGCEQLERPTCQTGTSSVERTVGYYESWASNRKCQSVSPEELNVTGFTHINYGFLLFDPNTFAIASAGENGTSLITRFTDLKTANAGLQTWVAIGGWDFNEPGPTATAFSDMVASPENRTKFINEVEHFMSTYAFDGLDLDWEYPSSSDRGGRPVDRENYALLTKELREAFGSRYGLSVTLPASYYYMKGFDVAEMEEHVDFFNIMSYDLHGVWDKETKGVGPYIRPHTNLTEIDDSLDLLWRAKVAPEKVSMGMAWYGRSFTLQEPNCTIPDGVCQFSEAGLPGLCSGSKGMLDLQEIQDIVAAGKLAPTLDSQAAIKYVAYNETQWVSYDDDETIALKQAFANSRCLGGTMVWAMDQANQKSACGLPAAVRPSEGSSSSSTNATANAECASIEVSTTTTCASIVAAVGNITSVQLKGWNPSIIGSWDSLALKQRICTSPPGGWYVLAPPPLAAAGGGGGSTSGIEAAPSATAAASADSPSKTQAGVVADCRSFATATAGDTCISFAEAHGIDPAQLYAWNPVLGDGGSACANALWAEESYCISAGTGGMVAAPTTSTASTGQLSSSEGTQSTSTSISMSAPAPTLSSAQDEGLTSSTAGIPGTTTLTSTSTSTSFSTLTATSTITASDPGATGSDARATVTISMTAVTVNACQASSDESATSYAPAAGSSDS